MQENTKEKEKLYIIELQGPWKRVKVDFIRPLEETKKGNQYIIIAIDYFT